MAAQVTNPKDHGDVIGMLDGLLYTKTYMSDGHVLRSQPDGVGANVWLDIGRVSSGIDPAQAFQRAKERQEGVLARMPYFAAYRKELHELVGKDNAWRIHTIIEMLAEAHYSDIDGIWSECNDIHGISLDVDDVATLVRLYDAAAREQKEQRKEDGPESH